MADDGRKPGWASAVLGSGGVAGVIAILITAAILYRYIRFGPDEPVPELLANALTIIIGFYFGASAATLAMRLRGGP